MRDASSKRGRAEVERAGLVVQGEEAGELRAGGRVGAEPVVAADLQGEGIAQEGRLHASIRWRSSQRHRGLLL